MNVKRSLQVKSYCVYEFTIEIEPLEYGIGDIVEIPEAW